MVLKFYPSKDATIYERYPSKNTGLDASLEIVKQKTGTILSSSLYNSRALLDFNYTTISASIVDMGLDPNLFDWRLCLYASEVSEIPADFNLYCYPISQSWTMGIGKYANSPSTTEGVSWNYRTGLTDTGSAWLTQSFEVNTTGSYTTNPGGGTWYTSSAASHSFTYTTTDFNFNLNDIIHEVQSGSIPFAGVIIKKSDEDEASSMTFSSLKFFSKDTSTVFLPTLEARYDDSSFTGSLQSVDPSSLFNVVPTNLQSTYSELATPIIRFAARPRYPARSFATSSVYLDRFIVSGSQYAIQSAQSDDMIVDFSPYTKVSEDSNGNYIKLHMASFQPERFYKILLRVPNSGSYGHQVFDYNWVFKVLRAT